jgi:hypothetical protein
MFDPSLKNTVFIRSSDARNMMWAAGHEFFHTLKVNHSDLYKAVIEIYKGMITAEQKAQYLKTFDKTPNLQEKLLNDENLLIEEMLADEAGNTITSESFWERVMEKSRNLFEKLASLVRELLSKMTRLEYVNYLDKEQISQFGKDFETIIAAVRSRLKEGETAEDLEFMDELPFSAREKTEKKGFDKAPAEPYNVNGGVDNGRRTEGSRRQVARESIEVRTEANRQVESGRVYRQRNSGVAERLRINGKDVPSTSYVLYEDVKKILIQKGKDLTEIHSVSDPDAFSDAISTAKKENPHGAYVAAHSVDEYSRMKTFLTRDGHSGIAVTDDGDIVSAFNNGSKSRIRGGSTQLLMIAIENGGKKLDNFGGKLSDIYAQHGFIPVARAEFSTDQTVVPPGWNYERDNHPDIIFWVHNGDSPETVAKNIGEYKLYSKDEMARLPLLEYSKAAEYRDNLLSQRSNAQYSARDREERGLSRKVEPQFDERISTEPPEDIRKKYIGEFHTVSKDKESDFNLGDFINKVYDKAFDNKQELNRFGKAFGQKSNEGLYAKALASMMSDKQARIILTKRMIDAKGDEIGKSLKEILKPVRQDKKLMQVLDDYLVYKHAPSWMEKGRVVFAKDLNITIEEVNRRAREIESVFPELVQIQKDIVEFQRQLAQAWLVDTGVLSAEVWRQFQKDYPDYVPLMRSFAAIEGKGGYRPKSGYVNQGSPIKGGKGSERDIINPIESIIEHVGQYTKVARRNEAGQSFLDIVRSNKENLKGVAEELWPELIMLGGSGEVVTTQVLDSQGNVIETMYFEKILEEDGLDGVVEKMQRLYQFQDEGAGSILGGRKGKGKVVTVLKDGKAVHIEVFDESLLNALMSITPRQQLAVVKALGSVTKTMKTLTTGMNLSFGIARNLWNDLVTGYVSSKTINANPLLYFKYIADLTAAAGDIIAESLDGKVKGGLGEFINNAAEKYKLYENVGGGAYASSVSADVKHLMRAKKDVLSERNIADYLIGTLETINNTLETAPRLAEFKRMITKEGNTHEGRSKAMYEANDLTVNFSRFGDDVKAIDNGVPFLNAAVQGIDKTVRIYKDNPLQAIMKSVWAVTIPTIILYCMNNRDDEHEKAYNMLSNYTKDNYFLIPYTDSEGIKYFKIPKGREIGIIWGAMPERIMRLFAKHDPEAFKDYANNVWNAWSPPDPVTDNILFPAYRSLILGKNWRFQDLESYAEQFESPQYRYSESTSGVAKALGKALNMSPKRLDDFFKSYLGGIAQYGIPLTSEKGGTVGKTFVQQITVDPVYSTDALNNFYSLRNELTTKHTDQKSGNYVMTAYEYSLYQQFNKISDSLSTYRKYINATSDPKEKRAYRKQMNELAMEVYEQGKALLEEERKE